MDVQHTSAGSLTRLTALCYGTPGSGKTYFGGTFPKPLFIDTDHGLATVRHKHVAFLQPSTYAELLECLQERHWKDYESVIVDTGTEATRIMMDGILKSASRDTPQMQDWQMCIERTRRLIRQLVDIPRHILFNCHEAVVTNEELGRTSVSPSLPGKLSQEAGKHFDCVFHARMGVVKGQKQRVLLTEPEGLYAHCKDRLGGLDRLEVPDFPTMWAHIQAANGATEARSSSPLSLRRS
jgi:hypothetical protein